MDKGEAEIRQDAIEHLCFLIGEVAACFILEHFQHVNEHARVGKIRLGFVGLGIGDATKKHGGLLGLHHDKFHEALSHFTGVD